MPVSYTYNSRSKIIHTDASGIVTVGEIVNYLESLLADDKIEYGSIEIFSLENATDLVMQYSDVYVFQDIWARYKKRVGQQVLVIAPTEFAYGLFRMLASVVTLGDEEDFNPFRIFTSREELSRYLDNTQDDT